MSTVSLDVFCINTSVAHLSYKLNLVYFHFRPAIMFWKMLVTAANVSSRVQVTLFTQEVNRGRVYCRGEVEL